MRESFVIHNEYIEDLPEESKGEFLLYIYNYGIKGEEPNLDGFAKTIWVKIKRRIDFDFEEWKKSKENRSLSGRIGGLKSGITRSKMKQDEALLQIDEANEATLNSVKQDEANEAVNVYVNDNVSVNDNVTDTDNSVCAYSFAQNDIKPLKTTPADANKVIKQAFEVIQTHNSTHGNMHKMPISKTYVTFLQKEGRQLCELFRDFDAADVLQALNNYLRVANIDTWKSTFSFSAFCKNCIEYTPEYFSIDKYEKTDFSKDADNKPIQRFKERMSQDSRFDIATFLQHSEEWLEKGRPEGEAYFALQEEWYRQEDAKAVNYDS